MKIFKIILATFLVIILFFSLLELIATKFFPEYSQNQIYKPTKQNGDGSLYRVSRSKNQYFKKFKGLEIRSDMTENLNLIKEYNTMWFFGDSVTNGLGVRYTDTYYFNLKRLLANNKFFFNIFAAAEYNNNLSNTMNAVNGINEKNNFFNKGDYFIYQFNYNDILPKEFYTNKTNRKNSVKSKKSNFRSFISFSDRFRFEYLHRLTFFRVLTHYASIVSKKTLGSCRERDIDALGQYTYAYGAVNYSQESKDAWKYFENKFIELNEIAKKNDLKFIVLISPISISFKSHDKLNLYNYDLKCSTIDGRKEIISMLERNNISYSDPLPLFQEKIDIDLKEKNFDPLFFEYDTNHPNSKGHQLLALSLFKTILDLKN